MTNELQLFEQFAKGIKTNRTKGGNCVIYTRVSTKEQADNNLSLETQKKACIQAANKNGYEIKGFFGGTYESAKTDERKEFINMLSFVKKTKEKISLIIVYSVDRFSRSGANAIYISEQLKKQGIQVYSVLQPTDTSTSSGRFQQNMYFIFSEFDNDQRRTKSMAGTREMLLKGDWPAAAPFGYDIIKRNGKREIIVNHQGLLLKKAFYWKLHENITHKEISERLVAFGLKMNIQRISDYFRNPFYCGLLAHKALEGQIIEGNHEKLISKNTFLQVNDLIKEKFGFKINSCSESKPLKKFIKCEKCGCYLYAFKANKNQKYYYKCCTIGCNCNRRADDLHKVFREMIAEYTLDLNEDYRKVIKREMSIIYNELNKQSATECRQMEKQLAEVEKKIERIEERYVLEEIDRDVYEKFRTRFKVEKAEIEKQMATKSNNLTNLDKCLEKAVSLSSKLATVWDSGDFTNRQNLQNLVFPEGLVYNREKDDLRTVRVNEVFGYIARQSRVLNGGAQGAPSSFLKYSALGNQAVIFQRLEDMYQKQVKGITKVLYSVSDAKDDLALMTKDIHR